MFRFKPVQILSRSFSSTARRQIATDINNGASGQKMWPSTKYVVQNYSRELVKSAQWIVILGSIMIAWPVAIRKYFDISHNVPKDKGAQVKLVYKGLKSTPVVEIAHTNAEFKGGRSAE
ncbi:uncharacterized protein SPAPADRAFT_59803 [Spathaspora passalidarum NRRL Y-27907]|uniref:Uncharacterized protein n=1 Tax=Spathaspora passalidarum (strain NRRL Y-27907 / 11-Y1) TaxID=619300 RepID=G3AI65_SPAPN|nr:uncharacterized protein SPAPADRAFT_59803 [Spathaspora passalidarum NRRL Y-27907]EGW34380.1 hypothetical protein SPAPADRAFT_59803 [Spathaspora passalidarum NRRL Y-27907]